MSNEHDSSPIAGNNAGPRPGDPAWKDNNPKAAFGAAKVGIDYLSFPVLLEQAVGMMAGGYKYGAHNYLVAGPSVMTYIAAAFRHMAAFVGGEEWDPHAGEGVKVHHLTAAQNCLHVVRAAQIQGIAFDDRPPKMPPGFIESLEPSIRALQKNNPDPVARYLATGRGVGRIIGNENGTANSLPPVEEPTQFNTPDTPRDVPPARREPDRNGYDGPVQTKPWPAKPGVTTRRHGFVVPDGYVAIRDEEGRATGKVRPMTDAELAGLK